MPIHTLTVAALTSRRLAQQNSQRMIRKHRHHIHRHRGAKKHVDRVHASKFPLHADQLHAQPLPKSIPDDCRIIAPLHYIAVPKEQSLRVKKGKRYAIIVTSKSKVQISKETKSKNKKTFFSKSIDIGKIASFVAPSRVIFVSTQDGAAKVAISPCA